MDYTIKFIIVTLTSLLVLTNAGFAPNGQKFVDTNSLNFLTPPRPQSNFRHTENFADVPPSQAVNNFAHKAVLLTAEQEAKLPAELLNPFYKNPRIRDALARESWFAHGEMPLHERAAERIPRLEIYLMMSHAGFVPRRRIQS